MTLTRRKPSGKPGWPIILLAGCEKAGKSWTAAAATGNEMFGTSLWIEIGECTADEYGAVPGARFEILGHDGSYAEILAQIRAAVAEPLIDGKPNLLVVDSMTELWDLLSDEQQAMANRRRGKNANGEATITMDQWNAAKKRWGAVLEELRKFPGPVVLTARLEQVAVVGANGQPTGASTWKIRAEKNLGYQVQVIMQAREPRQWVLTGISNAYLSMPEQGYLPWPGYTIADQLPKMGLNALDEVPASTYVAPDSSAIVAEADRAQEAETARRMLRKTLDQVKADPSEAVAKFKADYGEDLRTTLNVEAIGELAQWYASDAAHAGKVTAA